MISSACLTTWSLVTMRPSAETITPEPSEALLRSLEAEAGPELVAEELAQDRIVERQAEVRTLRGAVDVHHRRRHPLHHRREGELDGGRVRRHGLGAQREREEEQQEGEDAEHEARNISRGRRGGS